MNQSGKEQDVPFVKARGRKERKELRTHCDHLLNVMDIEIQNITMLGLDGEIPFSVAYASAEVLEFLVRETEHGQLVFWVIGLRGLEVPGEDGAVEFLCWSLCCSV